MSKSQMVIRKTKAAYLVKAWEENTGSGIEAEKKIVSNIAAIYRT